MSDLNRALDDALNAADNLLRGITVTLDAVPVTGLAAVAIVTAAAAVVALLVKRGVR